MFGRSLMSAAGAWLALWGAASAQTVTITGLDGQARTLTAAQIAAMPHESALLPREGGGAPKRYSGVPVDTLAQSVGAPSGKALRGPALADIVVVKGSDGYRAAFALAELDAGMRHDPILLADSADGAPLGADGPFRLVVEGDLRLARSVRMVTEIKVEAAP